MTLTPAFLDELRARTTLSTLVGKSVKLQRAGREWRACCPFHQEKTPSFYVNDDKGFYHCFGCSAHGDAIRWMTDQRGLPFMDAVKELAQVAGLTLPEPDRHAAEKAEHAQGLHGAMADAAHWFAEQLHGLAGAEARALLERRGVATETARGFDLGFAPDSRGKLRAALKHHGDPLLIEAGLLIQVEDKEPYDRFRGRLMIPIRDPRGRVIAFGGRVIGQGEPSTGLGQAKYLNSPDTPLFDKGRTLFNLDRAATAARGAGRLIVVEGYMDVIALAQAGVPEAVAPLGTALTEAQLERAWRLADVPILCFDGDQAGQKAAIRAATRALPMLAPGRSLAFATLPDGLDPDDLVRQHGLSALNDVLAKAEPLASRLFAHELTAEPLDTPERRAGLKRRLADHAERIADAEVRHQYRNDFRRRADEQLAPPPRSIQPRFQRNPRGQRWVPPPPPVAAETRAIHRQGIDQVLARAVLAGLIRHPAEILRHLDLVGRLGLTGGTIGRLFEGVMEAALAARQPLDSVELRTILTGAGHDAAVGDLLRADRMPYSFTRPQADPVRARADLDEAIAILVAAPELEIALHAATRAFESDGSEQAFAAQVALVREGEALKGRLANIQQAHEDAKAFETEGD